MNENWADTKRGYTIIELMVTVVIVAVLAGVLGTFVVKLLTLREQDREEAYIREKLADICASYADYLSIGASVSTNSYNQRAVAMYRQESGGVSFETGRVSHVTCLTSMVSRINQNLNGCRTLDLNISSTKLEGGFRLVSRTTNGDATLMPLAGDIVSCAIKPFGATATNDDSKWGPLRYLEVVAKYKVKNDDGDLVEKHVTAGRIVRLWNWTEK